MKNDSNTSVNQSMRKRTVDPRIAPNMRPTRLSIGNHARVGIPRSAMVGQSGPANVGMPVDRIPKQRMDVQPTWRGEFEDDFTHPAAAPSRTPITAGGIARDGQTSNSFRMLGDAFGARQ